jgi:hypothetical protein
MKTSADIVPVIAQFTMELQSLDYTWCTISIVDQETQRVRVYVTGEDWHRWTRLISSSGHPELPFSAATMERIENEEGPFYITGIPGGQIEYASYLSRPLDSYH